MIRIWKEEFPLNAVTMTVRLCRYLVKIFKDKFKSSLSEWRKYLLLIKTSAWITGKKFALTLFWAIKFETAARILNGEFGVNLDAVPLDESEIAEKAENHADSANETEDCRKLRRKIIEKYGAAIYNSWFAKIALTEENGRIKAEYPSNFVKDYVKNNFYDVFETEHGQTNENIISKDVRAKNTSASCLLFTHISDLNNFKGISAALNTNEKHGFSPGCGSYRTDFC
jgi:hypothetical protein